MASPIGIKIFEPRRVWLSFNLVFIPFSLFLGLKFSNVLDRENQRLVDIELDTLSRAHIEELRTQNYRAFVEGVGKEFQSLYVHISGKQNFSYGLHPKDGNCSSYKYAAPNTLATDEVPAVMIEMCRERSSFRFYGMALLASYAMISALFYFLMQSLEKRATRGLLAAVRRAGLEDRNHGNSLYAVLGDISSQAIEIQEGRKRDVALSALKAKVELAQQVAHDIRSPVAALTTFARLKHDMAREELDLLNRATDRIREIAEGLLSQSDLCLSNSDHFFDFSMAVSEAIELKKIEVSQSRPMLIFDVSIFDGVHFVLGNRSEFLSVVSNLLNNAVEATPDSIQKIEIYLSYSNGRVSLKIRDYGTGLSDVAKANVGKRGWTEGKAQGRGLGVFNAKDRIESWGGDFSISNFSDGGVIVNLSLRVVEVKGAMADFGPFLA